MVLVADFTKSKQEDKQEDKQEEQTGRANRKSKQEEQTGKQTTQCGRVGEWLKPADC